ncbi:MAG: hypothetical protein LBE34_12030 [Flavobacteriaceae bacterium]|jgi:hypothetical protein|nr:hypothetical protein [Flavobacteriaceae bacterium]
MKKLFMFLAVAGLATFGASCSKSDDSPAPAPAKELKLTANPQGEVFVGDVVNFSVSSGTEIIKDASIMEGGKNAVKDGKWTATAEGSFKFKATKTGYNPSNEVTVVVKKKVNPTFDYYISLAGVQNQLGYGIYGVDMYQDGVGADGKPKFVRAEYKLNNGKIAYMFTFQIFKGTNGEEDYDNAWEQGGVIQVVRYFIEKKAADSSPANTPVAEWMWADIYTILDGSTKLDTADSSAGIKMGFQAGKDGMDAFAVESSGNYTKPSTTAFELKYTGITEGPYRFEVKKPAAKSINSIKGNLISKAVKM